MTLQEAEKKLLSTTFLVNRFHHKAALKFLAGSDDPKAVDILAKHLGNHSCKEKIAEIISGFTEAGKKDRLWQYWVKNRGPELGKLLKKERIECRDPSFRMISLLKVGDIDKIGRKKDDVKGLLGYIKDADKDIKTSVILCLKTTPDNESVNDMIYSAWIKTESKELEDLIDEQNRKPSSDEKEVLFYLVRRKIKEYLELKDDEGNVFSAAFIMASKVFKKRINETVLKSQDARLTARYRKALARQEDFDPELYINALKEQDNNEGLFDATRYLSLDSLLDLCERWQKSGWMPEKESWRRVMTEAMKSFGSIEKPKIEKGSPPPKGTEDILTFWENSTFGKSSLKSEDPFVRAGGMYKMGKDNSISMEEVAKRASDSWPEFMTAALLSPEIIGAVQNKHIEWLKLIADIDYDLLTAKINCTPDEYDKNKGRLAKITDNSLTFHLLTILVNFQGVFGGWIVVEEDDSAKEKGAIVTQEIEDAGVVDF